MEGEIPNHHICPLSSLVELSIRNCYPVKREIPSDSFYRSSLEVSSVGDFNLMEIGIQGILSDIWNMSSLVELSLNNCNLKEGEILNRICHLSSLEELSLDGSHFCSIPTGITRLSNLRALNLSRSKKLQEIPELPLSLRRLKLSHCKKLQAIPELPSSLQLLDMHCTYGISSLSIHSLVNCFKSKLIQEPQISLGASDFGRSIVIPRSSGILEGTRNQSMGSNEVRIELPQNWYENNELLGFALCYCVPVTSEFELYCMLAIGANYQSKVEFECGSHWSKGIQIVIPGNNGIPKWISQQKKGAQITIELPMDCLKCKLNFHGHRYEFLDDLPSKFKSMDGLSSKFWPIGGLSFRSSHSCHHNGDELNGVWVAYYPEVAIPNQYKSNKWRHLKASFCGYLGSQQVKECGFHHIYMPEIVNRAIPQDTSIKGVKRDRTLILIQHPDVRRCCGTKSVAEDINANGQSCWDDTHGTDHDHSSMDTITQNIDDNVVDAQDDEEDHMHKWLYLLCKSI
ncbi:hypothetical protein PVL29_024964 [Vitis rotundifolia]|uniref:Uncharacterized protein n=1 Tax=Vitis rotundifolia TaxID=103349 RepID=A0AA39D9R4_VITRO|nr:hypothetical protein PVL29_024964 [Vitis rotundifolia]